MRRIPASRARERLYRLLDQVAESHEVVGIVGPKTTAVLVSLENWSSIQETVHLLAIPGMPESIREGLATGVEGCAEEPGW